MSELTVRGEALPDLLREPVFSPLVEIAVRQYLAYEAHGNLRRFGVPQLPAHLRERALSYLALAEQHDKPASVDAVVMWLLAVTAGVNNPLTGKDFGARAAAIAEDCSDLPGWGFSQSTVRDARCRFKWMPSVAEVREVVVEATAPRRAKIRALKAIAAASQPKADDPPAQMTAEVRDAVAAGLRGLVGEMDERARSAEASNPSGRPMKAGHLRPDVLQVVRATNSLLRKATAGKENGGD